MWHRFKILTLCGAVSLALVTLAHAQENGPSSQSAVAKPKAVDAEQLRQAVKKLSAENEQLRKKVATLEQRLKGYNLRDRLVQEEQRAENLQAQLLAAAERDSALQSQLDQVNEQLRPANLENIQVFGSLRPEEVRESARRRLTGEQTRIQSQIDLLNQGKARLQSSLSVTDMLIQNLRLQLQTLSHP